MDQHTGDMWFIYGTKHRRDNQLQTWDFRYTDAVSVQSDIVDNTNVIREQLESIQSNMINDT